MAGFQNLRYGPSMASSYDKLSLSLRDRSTRDSGSMSIEALLHQLFVVLRKYPDRLGASDEPSSETPPISCDLCLVWETASFFSFSDSLVF